MKILPSRFLACIASLLFLVFLASSPQARATSRVEAQLQLSPVTSIEGVTEYSLPNGLQVLLYPDPSSTTISVNVTYRVGSRNESYGENGMAHLLEHLNFKGTPRHPNITAEIATHGADANASTAYDRTNYYETFPASEASLEWALELEADRMVHSFIAQKDLDSEMTVVRNEFESNENNPTSVLEERVLETAYLWHNYGHPPIGSRSDIEHVPIERLQAFYHTYYQPDNASLVVAGNLDQQTTLTFIAKTFGEIPKPVRTLPQLYTEEPTQDGEREVTLRRVGAAKVMMLAYHIPADAHPDSAALSLLASILSDQPSGRLYKRLVEVKLATRVSAEAASLHDPSFLLFTAVLPPDGDLDRVRVELSKIIAGIRDEPFTQAELDRERNRQLNQFERIMNSSGEVSAILSENVAQGDWRLLFWDRDEMKKVSIKDLQQVAAKYLVSSNATLGMFIPEEKPLRAVIPPIPSITAMLSNYRGGQAIELGERLDPSPRAIEARTRRGFVGNRANGSAELIKTAFLERKTRGERVSGVLQFHFGSENSLRGRKQAGDFAAELLMRGTEKHSRQEIEDELTRLKATFSVTGGPTGVTVSFETKRANLPSLLRLVAEILKEPRFPENDFDEIKRAVLTGLEQAKTDPGDLARRFVHRYLSPYSFTDIRYVPTIAEEEASIDSLRLRDVEDFYHRFYGVARAEAAFVGSFDSQEVSSLLQELFGNWKSLSPYERVGDLYKETRARSETILTPDKANSVYLAQSNLAIRDDDPDYAALLVANEVFGGGFLNSRLATRIRQKDGLSYSVDSGLSVKSQDRVGVFGVFAICAPQNAAKVDRDVQEEIARALKDGFTAEEIESAKSGILQSKIVDRSSDSSIAGQLAAQLHLGRDFHWEEQLEEKIKSASADEILAAMRKYIEPGKMVTVEAGDFEKVAISNR